MASCCRRYRARRLKALDDDPKLIVIRPAAPATSLDHFKPFKLSTALMAVHKDCYAPIGLIQQGGPRRRETKQRRVGPSICDRLCRPSDLLPSFVCSNVSLFAMRSTSAQRFGSVVA